MFRHVQVEQIEDRFYVTCFDTGQIAVIVKVSPYEYKWIEITKGVHQWAEKRKEIG